MVAAAQLAAPRGLVLRAANSASQLRRTVVADRHALLPSSTVRRSAFFASGSVSPGAGDASGDAGPPVPVAVPGGVGAPRAELPARALGCPVPLDRDGVASTGGEGFGVQGFPILVSQSPHGQRGGVAGCGIEQSLAGVDRRLLDAGLGCGVDAVVS